MGDDERSVLTKLYEGLRDEVNSMRNEIATLNKHMLYGFGIIITGFVLPVGAAIIIAVFKL